MRRLAALLVVALGAAGVLVAPPPSGDPATPVFRTVGSALLACPALAVTEDSASLLSALVAPAAGEPDRAAVGGPDQDEGTASLRLIDGELDIARIPAPGVPVSLRVAARSQPPILVRSTGAFAASAVAGIASYEVAGAGAGLASAACVPPGPEWWFVGAGSQLGRGAALLISNPAQEPARFDISLFARSGPVSALAGKGVNLGPQSRVRLRLDALAQDEELLAIQVRTTSGRIAAALRDVAVPRGDAPRGVDYIPPAATPATRLHMAGIPGGEGSRDLVLVNPGTQFATLQVRLLTESGAADLPGLATLAVPAGSVVTTSLDRVLRGRAGTLELTSDVPVTGGVRSDWGSGQRDMSWLSAAPPVLAPNTLAAAVVPAGPGLRTSVTVAAPDGPVRGTLQVITTGGSGALIEDDGGDGGAVEGGGDGDGDDDGSGAGGAAAPARSGPTVLTGTVQVLPPLSIEVAPGSERTVVLAGLDAAVIAHLVWTSDPSSGPALVSHLTLDEDLPAATGHSWWPTASAVRITPAREDIGTLLPTG